MKPGPISTKGEVDLRRWAFNVDPDEGDLTGLPSRRFARPARPVKVNYHLADQYEQEEVASTRLQPQLPDDGPARRACSSASNCSLIPPVTTSPPEPRADARTVRPCCWRRPGQHLLPIRPARVAQRVVALAGADRRLPGDRGLCGLDVPQGQRRSCPAAWRCCCSRCGCLAFLGILFFFFNLEKRAERKLVEELAGRAAGRYQPEHGPARFGFEQRPGRRQPHRAGRSRSCRPAR